MPSSPDDVQELLVSRKNREESGRIFTLPASHHPNKREEKVWCPTIACDFLGTGLHLGKKLYNNDMWNGHLCLSFPWISILSHCHSKDPGILWTCSFPPLAALPVQGARALACPGPQRHGGATGQQALRQREGRSRKFFDLSLGWVAGLILKAYLKVESINWHKTNWFRNRDLIYMILFNCTSHKVHRFERSEFRQLLFQSLVSPRLVTCPVPGSKSWLRKAESNLTAFLSPGVGTWRHHNQATFLDR